MGKISLFLLKLSVFVAYTGSLGFWIYWANNLSYRVLYFLLLIIPIIYYLKFINLKNLINYKQILFILFCGILWEGSGSFGSIAVISLISLFILLDINIRKQVVDSLAKWLAIVSSISLIVFLLFMFGVVYLPSTIVEHKAGYVFVNFYFFIMPVYENISEIPRFCGCSLEPGCIGKGAALLLLAQQFSLRKWYNILLLIVCIATFSLASYLLLSLGAIMKMLVEKRIKLYHIFTMLVLAVSSYLYINNYNDGDNYINKRIFNRLEINSDGELSGDNRATDELKMLFSEYIYSSNSFLGMRGDIEKYTYGSSGYRVFMIRNGILGTILAFLFYFLFCKKNSSRHYFFLLLCHIAVFIGSGIPFMEYTLLSYVSGVCYLNEYRGYK